MTTTDPDPTAVDTASHAPVCHTCGVSLRQIILGMAHHADPSNGEITRLNPRSEVDLSVLLSMATPGECILMHQMLVDEHDEAMVPLVDRLWESAAEVAAGAMMPVALDELLAMLTHRPITDWSGLRIRFIHQYRASTLAGRTPGEVFDHAADLADHDARTTAIRDELRQHLDHLATVAASCETLLTRLTGELYDDEYAVGELGADLRAELTDAARYARAAVRTNREIVFPPST